MSLANYSDLQASIANWTHRTDLTSLIPDFVTMAEARITRDLRLRKQITVATLTTVPSQQTLALPSDWLEFENVSITSSPNRQLTYVPIEHIDANFSSSYVAMPSSYSIEGDNLLFAPTPDSAYSVECYYYARFPSLITDSTNWLMTNHPNIYLFACLIEAFLYTQNAEQAGVFTQRYMQGIDQLQQQDDRASHSGSALRVKVV